MTEQTPSATITFYDHDGGYTFNVEITPTDDGMTSDSHLIVGGILEAIRFWKN